MVVHPVAVEGTFDSCENGNLLGFQVTDPDKHYSRHTVSIVCGRVEDALDQRRLERFSQLVSHSFDLFYESIQSIKERVGVKICEKAWHLLLAELRRAIRGQWPDCVASKVSINDAKDLRIPVVQL
jgi:hypothetical protein